MFNRSTKLTALLVAAASVMTTVPAFAASKDRLGTKEGTIERGIAFKDGKYIFQGYKDEDNDDRGLYYNEGSEKDKLLDTDNINELASTPSVKYGEKFVSVDDDNDEYIVDLEKGDSSDEDLVTNRRDDILNNLRTKLRNTRRYQQLKDDGKDNLDLSKIRIDGSRFSEVWFEYKATTNGEAFTTTPETKGYVNDSRKYIDCSYNVNLAVYNGDKMVTLENVGDSEDDVTLEAIHHVVTVGQDDKYIYRVISAEFSGKVYAPADGTQVPEDTTMYYLQKVSKTQDDKEGQAYLPKETTTYALGTVGTYNGKNGIFDDEDMQKALSELLELGRNKTTAKAAILDDKVFVTDWDGHENSDFDNVKTFKLKFAKSEKYDNPNGDGKLSAKVLKKDGDTDQDCTDWSLDVDGTVWAIDHGDIDKSEKGGDFTKVYSCDTGLDKLDVYNEKNLIAWEKDGDIYTTVQEGKNDALKEAEILQPELPKDEVVKPAEGWNQDATTGAWSFVENGAKATGWKQINGTWFLMDAQGTMLTGWQQSNGVWYYLNEQHDGSFGAMTTGWRYDTNYGGWFYFDNSGAMQTGWYQDYTGTWYYSYGNGIMAANTVIDGYTLDGSGAWV